MVCMQVTVAYLSMVFVGDRFVPQKRLRIETMPVSNT